MLVLLFGLCLLLCLSWQVFYQEFSWFHVTIAISICIATLSTALVYCESSICFDKMKRGLQLMLYCNGIMCWIHLLRIERTLLLSITKLPSLPAGALGKGRGKKSTSLFLKVWLYSLRLDLPSIIIVTRLAWGCQKYLLMGVRLIVMLTGYCV